MDVAGRSEREKRLFYLETREEMDVLGRVRMLLKREMAPRAGDEQIHENA